MKTFVATLLISVGLIGQVTAQTRAAYQSAVNGQSPAYYFTFDSSLIDSVGGSLTLSSAGGGYGTDYFGNANGTRTFSGSTDSLSTSTDIIAGGGPIGGNASATGIGSISFLFRSLDSTALGGQRFLYGQGNTTGNANSFSMFFENQSNTDPGALKLRVGNGPTTTIMLSNVVSVQSWYYFALTYDETRDAGEVKWYLGLIGGSMNSGTINIGNVSVAGDNGTLVLGNNGVGATASFRNPGTGHVDEFAVWNRELNNSEINLQYASLVPEPSILTLIAMSGALLVGTKRFRFR